MVLVSTAFCLVYFLAKKVSFECTFFINLKIVMTLEHKHQDTYGETCCTIYRISFLLNYHIERSAVKMYISPYLFITMNDDNDTDDHMRPKQKQNLLCV
jgi:hypothetical protein